jgi:hypothetical protein
MKILVEEKDKSVLKTIDKDGKIVFLDGIFAEFNKKTHYGRIYPDITTNEKDLSKE